VISVIKDMWRLIKMSTKDIRVQTIYNPLQKTVHLCMYKGFYAIIKVVDISKELKKLKAKK